METTPPKDSSIINICIIPSEDVGNQCVALSQSLKSDSTAFVLDGENKFAHMTVYMARFSEGKIPEVIQVVKRSLECLKSFTCEHSGYFMTVGRYLEVSYKRSGDLMTLHESIVEAIKEYRINPGNPYEEGYFTPYTKEQQENAKETGYDLAHDLYRPHITLTRYKEGQAPDIIPSFIPTDLTFNLNKVCIYKADDNGAVYEKLGEFSV